MQLAAGVETRVSALPLIWSWAHAPPCPCFTGLKQARLDTDRSQLTDEPS